MTKAIPSGRTLSPTLAIDGADTALEWYKKAFGAKERMAMRDPKGRIMHGELQFGDNVLMIHESIEQSKVKSPRELGGTTSSVFFYVDDVDTVFNRAVENGATVEMAVEDMFWGDRFGTLIDPFGHHWALATHVEDVSEDEMERRGREFMQQMEAQHATA